MRSVYERLRRNKWLVGFFIALKFTFDIIDWVIGKIGYLGVFTAPDDYITALDRWPKWVSAAVSFLIEIWNFALGLLAPIWSFVVSGWGWWLFAAIVLFLAFIDVERAWDRLRYGVRMTVSEQVWVDRETAISTIRRSDWGRGKAPFMPRGLGAAITGLGGVNGSEIKFAAYCGMVLDKFETDNQNAIRQNKEATEYDETVLRR